MPSSSSRLNPASSRDAKIEQQLRGLAAVGEVGRVEQLLRGNAAVEVEQVDDAPERRVEEHALVAGERVGERREVGDPSVGDDELRLGIALDEPEQIVGNGGKAAASVDENRSAPFGGQREDAVEPLVVQEKRLRARVELDAERAAVEAARCLFHGAFRQIQPRERDQHAVRLRGGFERTVIRRAEGGMAVGLVQAEAERPRGTGVAQEGEHLLQRAVRAVDIGSAVEVSVEDLAARRDAALELGAVGRHQLDGMLDGVTHADRR